MAALAPLVASKERLIGLKHKLDRLALLEMREDCQSSLRYFVEQAWTHVDPSPFMANWAIDAVCDHLEAVMLGQIPNLLINIPPRCSKTTIVSIMFPAWVWLRYAEEQKGLLSGPQVRFLCASYSDKLSLLSANAFRRLVKGEWYQSLYPELRFMQDQDAKGHMDNNQRGSRQSTSVGGSLLGLGGDILIGDDLNNTETEKLVETGADRAKVKSFFNEFRSTRRNDPRPGHSAIIGVQQRTHMDDASGHWISEEDNLVHLMIPMRHDPRRHCVTVELPYSGEVWEDPRDPDGEELMWPERFGEFEVRANEKALGPIMAAGRLQQSPKAKGGNIINADWWRLWDEEAARSFGLEWSGAYREYPHMELIVASLDTAQKEKEENDFNALTVWGIFLDRAKNRRAMMMYGWSARLPLNGVEVSAFPNELPVAFEKRKKDSWGLVQHVADICRRYKVKRLLIEDKTRGHDVANEIKRQYARENWGVQLLNPVQDKVSRAHVTVPLFTDGAIWAPNTRWAQAVITQCEDFPKTTHDDYVDTVTQFINWAREAQLLAMTDEMSAANEDAMAHKGHQRSVADAYGV